MFKKLLAFSIIFLLIGMNVVSSTGNIVEDTNDLSFKEIESTSTNSDKRFYAGSYTYPLGSRLVWFDPDDPGTLNDIGPWPNSNFPGGGTFIRDVWWICDTNGHIYKVNLENGETEYVGNCGTGELVDLAWDPKVNTLWGISTSNFYSIDLDTGSATLAGNIDPDIFLLNIAADMNGNVWGLGFNVSGCNLYFIDTNTWNATLICNDSILPVGEISYEKDEDVMWGIGFNYTTFQGELWTIDIVNCTSIFVGTFQDGVQITCLSIPYNWANQPPSAPIVKGPKIGRARVEYEWTFFSTDPEEDNITYYIDFGDQCGGAEYYGPYPSGEELVLAHTYPYQSTFIINALAIDNFGAQSNWTYYEVTMPRSKAIVNSLFLWFLDLFPNAFQILQLLFKYIL